MKTANSLAELLEDTGNYGGRSPEYFEKMMHRIPQAKVVNRTNFILGKCKGKRVVNFGSASGKLHGDIKSVAEKVFGVDKVEPADLLVDLDDEFCPLHDLPCSHVYVCGEIIEHLSNPGLFLKKLRWTITKTGEKNAELVVSVPNALAEPLRYHAQRGYLNVNIDHVSWFCWRTLETLLGRFGFTIMERAYYEGRPVYAEGLIVVAK